mmetsp:Transcript_51650/g.121331  ORF Transcript_51650/g.121331 Transcript_51650/m.121331 type:complete len:245 (+) Transcript_51650:14-748(+)
MRWDEKGDASFGERGRHGKLVPPVHVPSTESGKQAEDLDQPAPPPPGKQGTDAAAVTRTRVDAGNRQDSRNGDTGGGEGKRGTDGDRRSSSGGGGYNHYVDHAGYRGSGGGGGGSGDFGDGNGGGGGAAAATSLRPDLPTTTSVPASVSVLLAIEASPRSTVGLPAPPGLSARSYESGVDSDEDGLEVDLGLETDAVFDQLLGKEPEAAVERLGGGEDPWGGEGGVPGKGRNAAAASVPDDDMW